MIRKHIKIGWKKNLKCKGESSVKTWGLAMGLVLSLIMLFLVINEPGYDPCNNNFKEILVFGFKSGNHRKEMKDSNEHLQVMNATKIRMKGSSILILEDRIFRDSKFAYLDPNFFDVFIVPEVGGNSDNPFDTPHSRGITPYEARKLFGKQYADFAQKIHLW